MNLNINNIDFSKWARLGILWLVLGVCTANVCNSFFIKWGLREKTTYVSLESVINKTAYQPYVYRGAIPRLVDQAVSKIDEKTQLKLFKSITNSDVLRNHFFNGVPEEAWTPRLAIDYHIMYALITLSFATILIFLRKIFLHFKSGFTGSILAISLFSFFYPLLFNHGAYFYDFFELLGLTVSTYFFIKNKKILASLLLLLTAFNKETAFVTAFGFFFLHEKDYSKNKRFYYFLFQIITCLIARYLIMVPYAGNTDSALHFHLFDNIIYWLNPIHYLKVLNVYAPGIYVPAIENIFLISWLIIWVKFSWENLSPRLKQYTLGIFIPNFMLFFTFGSRDEFRNLSLSLLAIYILLIHGFDSFKSWIDGTSKQSESK